MGDSSNADSLFGVLAREGSLAIQQVAQQATQRARIGVVFGELVVDQPFASSSSSSPATSGDGDVLGWLKPYAIAEGAGLPPIAPRGVPTDAERAAALAKLSLVAGVVLLAPSGLLGTATKLAVAVVAGGLVLNEARRRALA